MNTSAVNYTIFLGCFHLSSFVYTCLSILFRKIVFYFSSMFSIKAWFLHS